MNTAGCYRVWVLCLFSLLAGCTAVELDQLVPTAALSLVSDGLPTVTACNPWAVNTTKAVQVASAAETVKKKLPTELASDAVVNALASHATYVATHSTNYAASLVKASVPVAGATIPPPAATLSTVDFARFTQLVVKHIFRRMTLGASDGGSDVNDPFWIKLRRYYAEYFNGSFHSYLGDTYTKPSPSLTINDTEIVQGVSVFIEFLWDEILQSTVWTNGTNFYPAGTKDKPTYLLVNNLTATSIPTSTTGYGCGMNTFKADQIRYLAQTFSKAAAGETSLTIKTAGSIEIGLGIVGKLNIGDNSTLALLIQGAVSEAVARLTVQLAAPILSALDFEQSKSVVVMAGSIRAAAVRPKTNATTNAQTARAMTSLFTKNDS